MTVVVAGRMRDFLLIILSCIYDVYADVSASSNSK